MPSASFCTGHKAWSMGHGVESHFESCFNGIQLLVVDEPSPLACVAHNIFEETPVFFYLDLQKRLGSIVPNNHHH